MFVDHRVKCIHLAQHFHDRELFFVQRIAFEDAIGRARMGHEARAVESGDGFLVCHTRGNYLAPAGPARHEMRLDQPRRDANIRLDESAIKFDRGAVRRFAKVNVIFIVAREMIRDGDRIHHPIVADQLAHFVAFVRAMQSGRD